MKRLLVLLFVAVITLPLAVNLAGIDGADAGAENRELAPFPAIGGSLASLAAFPTGLSGWFDDHFGLRSVLVRRYGESRRFWPRASPSPPVSPGKQRRHCVGAEHAAGEADADPDAFGVSLSSPEHPATDKATTPTKAMALITARAPAPWRRFTWHLPQGRRRH